MILLGFKIVMFRFFILNKQQQKMSRFPEPNLAFGEQVYHKSQIKGNQLTTGTEKMVVTKTHGMTTTSQKSSYHNPVSAVSQKYAIETREVRRRSSSSQRRNRSRSRSNQRKMKNLAYQDQLESRYRAQQVAINQPAQLQRIPLGNVSNTLRQPTHAELGPQQYSRKKQKFETKGDRVITEQKLYFFDPVTGKEQSKILRTELKDPNLQNQPVRKQTYEHKIIQTPSGPEEEIKVTHREGSVLDNIKNKLTNMMNRGF